MKLEVKPDFPEPFRNSATVTVRDFRGDKSRIRVAKEVYVVAFISLKVNRHVPVSIGAIKDAEPLQPEKADIVETEARVCESNRP